MALTPLTEKVIILTLQNKFAELKPLLQDLSYKDLITLYAMCFNLSKAVKEAPNFFRNPKNT